MKIVYHDDNNNFLNATEMEDLNWNILQLKVDGVFAYSTWAQTILEAWKKREIK